MVPLEPLHFAGETWGQKDVEFRRFLDLPARGWWSGDLHVHMNYGGTYRNTPAHLVQQARAEDLHLVENLIEAVNILGSLFYGTILGLFLTVSMPAFGAALSRARVAAAARSIC